MINWIKLMARYIETSPIASKRMKCPAINICKLEKDVYSENYKMLMREIEDDANR